MTDSRPWDELTGEERVRRLDDILGPPPTPAQVAEEARLHEATYAAVNSVHPDLKFVQFGGACPEQGYGWWQSREAVYYRYRHDFASLEIGPPEEDQSGSSGPMPQRGAVRLYAELGGWDGNYLTGSTFTPEGAAALLTRLVELLRPVEEWPDGTRLQRFTATVRAALDDEQDITGGHQ